MAPSKRTSRAKKSAPSSASASSSSSRPPRSSGRQQKSTFLAPKSTAPPTPSTAHPTPSHASLVHSLSLVAARARASLGVPLYAEYRDIALLDPSQPDTIFRAAASPHIRAALDVLQQEDREMHDRKQNKRTVPRAMRVRYVIIAAAPQLGGRLLTPLTHLINHAWGISDNAPANKTFFGSDHLYKFPLHEGSSKPGGAGQSMSDAAGLTFHSAYIRSEAAKHIENGTPAEWAKEGNGAMHLCIDTLQRFLAGEAVHVQNVEISLRADGSPIISGYPGGERHPMIHSPVAALPIAKKIVTKKSSSKSAATKRQPRSKKDAASASVASAPSPCKRSLRRSKLVVEAAETVVEESDSGSEDDHTDAASVQGSASVISGPPSPASRSSVERFAAEVEPIEEGEEEDEWQEKSNDASEKAPTEAASSLSVLAPSSPIVSADASIPAWSPPPSWYPDPSFAEQWQERKEGEESLHSLFPSSSSSSSSASSSSLLRRVLSDREAMEQEAMDLNVSWRRSLQTLIDDDEQRELQLMMMMHGSAVSQQSSGAASFEPRWSPLSFSEARGDASSCLSPSPSIASEGLLSYPLVSNALSDDDLHSAMEDEEVKEAQEWAVMQLQAPSRRVEEDAEESQWAAFQPNSVAQRILPFLKDEFQSGC